VPSFAEELNFRPAAQRAIVTFSLKARAPITWRTQSGRCHWFDGVRGSPHASHAAFHREQAKSVRRKLTSARPGRFTPGSAYWYERKLSAPSSRRLGSPHFPAREKTAVREPDNTFYEQWASEPYADTAMMTRRKSRHALKLAIRTEPIFLAVTTLRWITLATNSAPAAAKSRTFF